MNKEHKFSLPLSTFSGGSDRFVAMGYQEPKSIGQLFDEAVKLAGIQGLEFLGGTQLNERNVEEIKKRLKKAKLSTSLVIADIFTHRKWANGTFSSSEERVRKEAISEVKRSMDLANQLSCDKIGLWLGQDGFDYSFQADYRDAWGRIIEGIKECADYRPDIKICIEYKIKEPRAHIFTGTIGKTLLLIDKVGRDNVGANLDIGHSFMAYENPAETVAMLKDFGDRLFHLHLNDNYRLWDDDLVVASVHTIEYLEILYWLKQTGYNGWYSLDIFPVRESALKAATESIEWIKGLYRILDRIGYEKIKDKVMRGDALGVLTLLREEMLS